MGANSFRFARLLGVLQSTLLVLAITNLIGVMFGERPSLLVAAVCVAGWSMLEIVRQAKKPL